MRPPEEQLKTYRKKGGRTVVAIRLDLDFAGFGYEKWGATQSCKRGDWIVDNDGEIYTINAESFAETYREVSRGLYRKVSIVWAEVAEEAGMIETKEGASAYEAGDYLVYNQEGREDGYAIIAAEFVELYEEC